MKFTFSWLCDHLDTKNTLSEICDALPMLGLEVEALNNPIAALAQFRVVEITEAKQHPDADRLRVCRVKTGRGELQVVLWRAKRTCWTAHSSCPCWHPRPWIRLGYKKSKIRGQTSEGMLCSLFELGLDEEHEGIAELPSDVPVGICFADFAQKEYASLVDPVIEIAITPNRGDCLGIRGVARDLAASGDLVI